MKKRPNHREYLRVLRRMGPEERLRKAFDLSDFSHELFRHGLRKRFPDQSGAEFENLVRSRLEKCHNRLS